MSKSKGNIVDPDSMIKQYGADALRLFILFAAPPETELEWDDRGLEGTYKFLNRIWRISENLKEKASPELVKIMHRSVKKITEDIESFKFNTAIAGLMEFVNAIYQSGADREVFETLLLMVSPIAPHFAEELWQSLGNKGSICRAAWPRFDAKYLVDAVVTIIIQVNGKLRAKIEVPSDIKDEELRAKITADEKLKPWIENKEIKNFIIVPKKIVNIVVV